MWKIAFGTIFIWSVITIAILFVGEALERATSRTSELLLAVFGFFSRENHRHGSQH